MRRPRAAAAAAASRRWTVTVALAVALSSFAVLTPPAPVAAESRLLSFLSGGRTSPPPVVRDSPKSERQWLFGVPSKTSTPRPVAYADKTTEDRRRVPRPTVVSPVRYQPTTTTTTVAPTTVAPTTTTTTAVSQKLEATTRKIETTTSERHIITAPLNPCPAGQRMSPDRKCVENYTDPEDRR